MGQALRTALGDLNANNRSRCRRSEYGWCMLACVIYYAVLLALRYLLEDVAHIDLSTLVPSIISMMLSMLPIGLFVIEHYCRLHDTGHSDRWLSATFLPLVGLLLIGLSTHESPFAATAPAFVRMASYALAALSACSGLYVLYLCTTDSDKDDNLYGPSPKYERIDDED